LPSITSLHFFIVENMSSSPSDKGA
jgi:hypothetical protein